MDNAIATGNEATQEAVVPGKATSMEFTFYFRTDKIRDDEGKVIGTGRKHPDVKSVLLFPTDTELAQFLVDGGKEAELIREAVKNIIDGAARNQINDWREANGLDKDFTATNFDLSKLTLTAIANTPKSERGGPAISDEDWTAFLDDYSHTMVQGVSYDPNKVKLHVAHYKTQFRRIKNDKAAVQKLLDLLNVWASKTENLEDYTACYDALAAKASKYLKADEKDIAGAL